MGLFYFKETVMTKQKKDYDVGLVELAEKLLAYNLTALRDNTDDCGFCGGCLKVFKLKQDQADIHCPLCGSANVIF